MEKDFAALKNPVAGAVKSAGTASNTGDSFKATTTKLDARVAKLEKKVF